MKDQNTFIITHTFKADVKRLFSMWLNPDLYTQWMGPAGAEMSFVYADVREDGEALWQMTTPDGSTKYGKLLYKTIEPDTRFEYVQHFSDQDGNFIKAPFSETYPDRLLLTVDFGQEGNKIKMTVKWEIVGNATEAEQNTFNDMKPFMVKGWGESFEKMQALLQ